VVKEVVGGIELQLEENSGCALTLFLLPSSLGGGGGEGGGGGDKAAA
jgi:hypothetical protein